MNGSCASAGNAHWEERMRKWFAAALVATLGSSAVTAGEPGDRLAQSLYDGTLAELADTSAAACQAGEGDACFALGLHDLITAYEGFARGLYRHGATAPSAGAMGMLLGLGLEEPSGPANPNPEPLTYEQFRDLLDAFSKGLDAAAANMKLAGEGTPFVIHIDPLQVRIDLDGNGEAAEAETLGALMGGLGAFVDIPAPDAPPEGKSKSKDSAPAQNTVIGFDNADAIWFAGYSNIVATPLELALAHDFSSLFDAYFHRLFPKAGLMMGEFVRGNGSLVMDAESDAFIADVIAAIHTADFPVADAPRLAAIITRLSDITALSRRNWELILAETDDDRELVPSPRQTSLVEGRKVNQEIVDAWLATLDSLDEIIAGDLLLPHWRFDQGFSLKTFFETATETDLVLLLTGQAALPYLAEGPIADMQSFAELNRAMGDEWPFFALWFN
jgi:hypothetical protein